MGAPTRIVLVRHGDTDLTVAGTLDGRGGPDPLLNAEGRRQAWAIWQPAIRRSFSGRIPNTHDRAARRTLISTAPGP